MNSQLTLEQELLQGVSFEVAPPPRFSWLCEPGQKFADLIEARVSPVRAAPTELSVNQTLLLLQNEFFARFEAAPKAHRTLGSPHHTCLVTVYLDYLRELIDLRSWKVNPPLVREPTPVAPPQFEIAGVPFGIKKSG